MMTDYDQQNYITKIKERTVFSKSLNSEISCNNCHYCSFIDHEADSFHYCKANSNYDGLWIECFFVLEDPINSVCKYWDIK